MEWVCSLNGMNGDGCMMSRSWLKLITVLGFRAGWRYFASDYFPEFVSFSLFVMMYFVFVVAHVAHITFFMMFV